MAIRHFRLGLLVALAVILAFVPRAGRAAEAARDNVPPAGFEALFNGADVAGWTEQGKPPEHWSARDGMLVYDGKGKDLHSQRRFGDFVLLLDWKVNKGGNSGVYLRGSTQVEINDGDPPTKPIWNGTTGGIYPDLPPIKRAAKPAGEWNHFEIRVEKGVITVVLNGEVTVDAYAKKWGDRAAGPIGFQNHGTPIWIKNLFIKSLDATPATAPAQKQLAATKPVSTAGSMPAQVAVNRAGETPEDRSIPEWIWHSNNAAKDEVRYFRKTFRLDAAPAEATLSTAGDNGARVYVNGVDVGDSKGWNAPLRARVEKHLKAGDNVIAVRGRNEGGTAALVVRLDVRAGDGTAAVKSDATWTSTDKETPDWEKRTFDASGWTPAVSLGKLGIEPWGDVLGDGKVAKPESNAPKSLAPTAAPSGQAQAQPAIPPNAKAGDLTPAEATKWFTLPKDYAIDLVAAEPLVVNPVSMALDEQGRIYVGESHTYRYGKDKSPVPTPTNPIVMLKPFPNGKGFERVIVAEGFDDPVMGLLVKRGRMWATANDQLFCWDVDADGKATNRRTLLTKGKGWNPFGFFVLKFGPDGLLYLSMGSHDKVTGPGGQKLSPRGGGGIVCRMNPDATNIEVLTQGFRVPFAFDIDPFGQHWQLSNGEGNPNRFAKIINAPAADFHCFTRTTDSDWLSGLNPLGPPAFAIQTGAYTSLLAYHGAAFPESMRGNLFAVNWGGHGRGNSNHAVDVYEPDARRNVYKPAAHWLTSADPHFRPTTILVAPDGTLLLSDFYNRDDESDLTGRIWRIKYVGDNAPATQPLRPAQWTEEAFLIDALGSADHLKREKAADALAINGNPAKLGEHAATARESIGAAMALWTLARLSTPESLAAMARGASHPDWQVRRLAAILAKRYRSPATASVAEALANDPDPAVRVAAAVCHDDPAKVRAALLKALAGPSGVEAFTRYEACTHLARVADGPSISALLNSDNPNVRLAGLIVIDLANHEKTDARPVARAALAKALADPGSLDVDRLLDLAAMNPGPDLAEPLAALVRRKGLPTATVARGVLLMLALPAKPGQGLDDVAKTALAGLREGQVPIRNDADRLAILRLLPYEGPTPFAIRQIAEGATKTGEVGRVANELARSFAATPGTSAPSPELTTALWKLLADPATGGEQRAELLATVAALDKSPDPAAWATLLTTAKPKPDAKDLMFAREVVRAWRRFAGNAELTKLLVDAAPALLARDPTMKPDLAAVLTTLSVPPADAAALGLPAAADEAALRTYAAATKAGDPLPGRMVFTRAGCAQCHSSGTDARLGPPLAGVGTQSRDYLIESIFEPSKVIKTGFDTELVRTKAGDTYSGLVIEVGDNLQVTTATAVDVVPKADVEVRKVQKLSIMPDGLAKPLSPAELNDLLAYLQSLKATGAAAK